MPSRRNRLPGNPTLPFLALSLILLTPSSRATAAAHAGSPSSASESERSAAPPLRSIRSLLSSEHDIFQPSDGVEDNDGADSDYVDTPPAVPQHFVIGGTEASPLRYPYLASLEEGRLDTGSIRGKHICAGTLIAPDIVLSAAHCDGTVDTVVLGVHDREEYHYESHYRQYLSVKATVRHPAYQYSTWNPDINYDFLLVKLDGMADLSRFSLVKLNRDDSVPSDDLGNPEELVVAGWGATDPYGAGLSEELQHATLDYVPRKKCDEAKGYVDGHYYTYEGFMRSNMMCAWSLDADACIGDSGGPLLLPSDDPARDLQVGIISFGVGCLSPDFPGIYARVSDQMEWIDTVVCDLSEAPPGEFCSGARSSDEAAGDFSEVTTLQPTPAPTDRPTERPTVRPTARPTVLPTARPTARPTNGPTASPSIQPITSLPTDLSDPPGKRKPTVEPGPADDDALIPTAMPSATHEPTSSFFDFNAEGATSGASARCRSSAAVGRRLLVAVAVSALAWVSR